MTHSCPQILTDDFLGGKLDIDSFLGRYIEMRTLSHLRKVKCDKMTELLKQDSSSGQHRRQSAPASNKQTPFAQNYSAYINTGSSSSTPYPPYPAQNNSFVPYPMPSYAGPSYGHPMSMPAPYYPGAYPQPNLH